MKTKLFLMCVFMLYILTLSAQSYPYLSGPGIDVGTVAKVDSEQIYKVKYSQGTATEDKNQLVQWEVDPNQCDIISRNGKTASITLKWKKSGIIGSLKAYNVYSTNAGMTSVSSSVAIGSTSVGGIVITAPTGGSVGGNLNISVEVKNTIGWFTVDIKADDFTKMGSEPLSCNGYFNSPGTKTITVTVNLEGGDLKTVTKQINILPSSITGDDAFPFYSQRVYSLLNAPSGVYTWTVSNGLKIVSGQGSPSIIVEAIGSLTNASISVSAFGVSLSKGVAVGIPDINLVNATLGFNNTLYAYFTNRNECRATYSGNGSILEYEWTSTSWEVSNPLTSNKSVVFLKSLYTPASSTANIVLRARNAVGWSSPVLLGAQVDNSTSVYLNYNIKSLKNGFIMITKNEQKDSSFMMNGDNQKEMNPIYEIYNQFTGVLVKRGNLVSDGGEIDVSGLPSGIYVVSLIMGANRQTEKVIIQH